MGKKTKIKNGILYEMKERAKELECLYRVDEILSRADRPVGDVLKDIAAVLPDGWRYPDVCRAVILLDGEKDQPRDFEWPSWRLQSDIYVAKECVGNVSVYYTEEKPAADEGPFLKEERRLIGAIAERIGLFLLQRQLRSGYEEGRSGAGNNGLKEYSEWCVIMDFLRRTDQALLARITRKMINYLCWSGAEEADELLREFTSGGKDHGGEMHDENKPTERQKIMDIGSLADKTFAIASRLCSEEDMISNIRVWIEEEKAGYLIESLENLHSHMSDVAATIERFESSDVDEDDLPSSLQKSLRVSLLRRFFTDDMKFLSNMRDHVRVSDFHELLQNVIYPSSSHGKLGGKSTGLFQASKLLRISKEYGGLLANIKIPRTWYVTSDCLVEFMHYNNLEGIHDRKYLNIEQIRRDYPHIIQVFKNSKFPPEISKGLSTVLDDFEGRPLVVRSSSLLEDQMESTFSGKYKSLFVANQGTKKERLAALEDAIAEVYASIFGPDPIQYRAERGLLDVYEEMAIMIQEVVGERVGKYFLPAFAGVALSCNEFCWSPRIKRDDGLMRLVPGLGTRAVDRLSDDYPVLIAPGRPDLRVNVSPDEIVRYAPRKIDVIDLENNSFATIPIERLLHEAGDDYPLVRKIVSIVEPDRIRRPTGLMEPDWDKNEVAVTFQGMIEDGSLVDQIWALLVVLREQTGYPVDVEFAADGKNLYLVQCRAQSTSPEFEPAPIPRNVSRDNIVFTAKKYVSNGHVPDVTHIVYIDPDGYAGLGKLEDLKDVGCVVGKLNKLLPKRRFVLIGPGRWGSRGDIRLGVPVTYSDVCNSSMLLEVARKKGNYIPELSFGTHFFQDLVEANIRYLPLYPDEDGVIFNEGFLHRSKNLLPDLLPEFGRLKDTVHVIDVPLVTDGKFLNILMNADLGKAVGILSRPSHEKKNTGQKGRYSS